MEKTFDKEFYIGAEGEYRMTTGAKSVQVHVFPGMIGRPSDDHKDLVEYAKRQMKVMHPRTKVVKVQIHEVIPNGTKGGGREHFRYDI